MRKKVVETCEMCSNEVRNPTTIKVEGALLRVCPNCVSFGNVVEERRPATASSSKPSSSIQQSRTGGTPVRSKSTSKKDEDKEILIENYGNEIKRARMKKKMTQEQLGSKTGVSNAYIRSIENEKMKPTDRVAKKLEQALGIELFETMGPELEHQQTSKKKGLTVGDIVKITRYEYD